MYGFHTDAESTSKPVSSTDGIGNEFEDDVTNPSFQQSSPPSSRMKAAATWILMIQETFKLPQSSMELILKDVTGFIQDMLVNLFDEVTSVLTNAGIDSSSVPGLSSLFSSTSVYAAPFAGLEMQHLQMRYYKESLGFVVSSNV